MSRKPSRRQRPKPPASPPSSHGVLAARRLSDGSWELVHPRCATDRQEDLQEVRKMLDAGEIDVARDECRWLLEGCTDCLEAHRLLGEIAVAEGDWPLARGHFGYAYRLGVTALDRAGTGGPLPASLPANRGFFDAGASLVYCLRQLHKPQLAAEIVARLLELDPGDPMALGTTECKPCE